ncbi:flavin monoamine oxidase family protein [Acaryochloris marina NIES-2412]|uniref:flavin monoamine oxidase family protein n=1 Tax=Acaryochloris marina TaxID=155978 RepID=UPI0040581D01
MPESISRREYLKHSRSARAWAALDHASNEQMQVTYDPCTIEKDSLNGKHVVVIGSGVGGLTTAFEILDRNSDVKVTVLEARDRTGGRCLTLRTGDTLTEDKNSNLYSSPGETQVTRFERPLGDSAPYLNAGPGRIPSSHKRLLNYLRRFGVPVEVYVMNSGANLAQMSGGPDGDDPVVYRRLEHNVRGWIAQMVFKNVEQLLGNCDDKAERVEQLKSLMVTFGDLVADGEHEGDYIVGTSVPGQDDNEFASDRAGFDELPGVRPGKISPAFSLEQLLASEFWKKTRFYQPVDFLWQPTLFQPVGGMDNVQHAFAQQVAVRGGVVHLNSPVTSIDYDSESKQFVIQATGHEAPFRADYCFSNVSIPFLEKILAPRLQNLSEAGGFSKSFKEALQAVYIAQANPNETQRFIACTTKVGWQADRSLWQGKPFKTHKDEVGHSVFTADQSEVGVVPIYGGISWTNHPITQIWYPSDAYHDQKGVLTGAYNFGNDAAESGRMSVQKRLNQAREGAALFGKAFGAGLENGVAIAWQNIPYIKGGWAQWSNVNDSVRHYNQIIQGTGVDDTTNPCFFIIGDQTSSLPGWQEGAIASALNAISRLAHPDRALPHLKALPDTRLMVEGL